MYRIAKAYGVSVEAIASANELNEKASLVVGQALVIPLENKYHIVQPGQSFYTIALMYGMSAQQLASYNGLSTTSVLQIGQKLHIPQQTKNPLRTFLYVEPRSPVSEKFKQEVRNRVKDLTYLGMFSYAVQEDGTLVNPPINDLPTIAKDGSVLNALVVTNLKDFAFSPELAHTIFTNPLAQTKLFNELVQTAKEIGFSDIHFDFEFMFPEDRELYTTFLTTAKDRFHAEGLKISAAVAPKSQDIQTGIYGAFDYAALGEILDYIMLMTYEWGYTYSTPQAVSPIGPVSAVLNYAKEVIPAEKIFLGQNLYGYDWLVHDPSISGEAAKAISPQQAIQLARENHAAISYDPIAQAPYFRYYDSYGKQHEVWFEDARSIQAKFDLVRNSKIGGMMYWKLGLSFPQNWELLQDQFTIVKQQ